MKERNIVRLGTGLFTVLLLFGLIFFGSTAYAAFEVPSGNITADSPPPSANAVQWTDDITVQWTAPSFTGTYTLVEFVYKWTSSSSALNYTNLNADNPSTYTPNGGTVDKTATPYVATLDSSVISTDDFDDLRYLHLKTVYLDVANPQGGILHSSDTVTGPFNVDNVVSGTIRLPDPTNPDNDLTSTTNTQITLEVGYPTDVADNGLYLNETATRPAQGVPYTTTTYTLTNTTSGSKTIYAWFKDRVGNTSTLPVSASFTLLEPVSIDPNTATIDLAVTDTRTFRVQGTSAGYTWTVVSEVPQTAGADVAQLSGTTANTNQVTLQGLNAGTCKLTAQSDSTVLTSGTITITGTPANLDVDGNGTADGLTDGILVIRYLFGITGSALIADAVDTNNCTNCTADDIESYLAVAQTAILDVDGNGTADGLTDGILVIRYLFGITGSALIADAVDTNNCTRCTAQDIEAYLAQYD